ncbi:MAG: hypothetical protein CVV49_00030 [Spirochaetae bacterium HGW-Spirochaetae-5]|nr:MAG: hypothetical protein CVV49_00030 [Spirochaetae bacterium HGW-Spirochaetae-5]
MNQNKKIIISLGIFFSIILLSISLLKISINILYPVNELSNSLKDSFKDIFGKAIKFDTLYFKYNGDIVLQNFYLSNKDDFNDNINLIKCDEITIDTGLFDLIRKKITFAGVYMAGPEINFNKNYGKPYYEIFVEDLTGGINQDKIKQFIKSGFRFELTGSKLYFKETFKNSKSETNLYDLDLKIKYGKEYISYRSYGYIENKIRESWRKSSYRARGKIYLNKPYSESELKLENLDLTHLNNFLNDRFDTRTFITGSFSGNLNVVIDNGILKCSGNTGISSMDFFYYEKNSPYPLFKNKDIDSNFSFSLSENLDRLKVDKLEIDDGVINLSSIIDYAMGDSFSIELKSNKINLTDLSESVFLFRNSSYTGEMSFNGICNYKIKENAPEVLNFNLILDKFNIIPNEKKNKNFKHIQNGDIFLSVNKDNVKFKADFKSGKSDFNITFDSLISGWNPIKSSNNIEIKSKTIELNLLKIVLKNSIKKIYNMAYVDMFQNFDEQRNFLKEPEGIFINNNDITLKLTAEKLSIAGKSNLNNLVMDISLLKGILKTGNFKLEGYDGIYSFNLYSSLRQEYPYFKFTSEAKNIDLDRISYESGLTFSFGGRLSLDAGFETSAYRIGQVVENGKAGLNISVQNGYLNNTPVQNKLHTLLSNINQKDVFNKRLEFSSYSIGIMQSGTNFYIKNFSLDSADMSFSSFGSFTEENGLKIPINLNVNKEKITERVPLEIYGNLETPCVKVKSKNETESVCF